jgi:hypothetical protein
MLGEYKTMFTSVQIAHDIFDLRAAQLPQIIVAQPIGNTGAQSMLASGLAHDVLPLPMAQADINALARSMAQNGLRGAGRPRACQPQSCQAARSVTSEGAGGRR